MTLEEFEIYNAENPQIYEAFERFTFEAINAGRKYFGAGAIIERIRWFTSVESKLGDFKVCNDIKPFYARLFEIKNPKHEGFFRKKGCPADEMYENKEIIK